MSTGVGSSLLWFSILRSWSPISKGWPAQISVLFLVHVLVILFQGFLTKISLEKKREEFLIVQQISSPSILRFCSSFLFSWLHFGSRSSCLTPPVLLSINLGST